ncbi:hypothetical protein HDU76_013302 [Blyttiomyces sp. JEL0837]|nr:hypothetical protein HDU76_013302 [Blyttiomyces sp. JEL0837]
MTAVRTAKAVHVEDFGWGTYFAISTNHSEFDENVFYAGDVILSRDVGNVGYCGDVVNAQVDVVNGGEGTGYYMGVVEVANTSDVLQSAKLIVQAENVSSLAVDEMEIDANHMESECVAIDSTYTRDSHIGNALVGSMEGVGSSSVPRVDETCRVRQTSMKRSNNRTKRKSRKGKWESKHMIVDVCGNRDFKWKLFDLNRVSWNLIWRLPKNTLTENSNLRPLDILALFKGPAYLNERVVPISGTSTFTTVESQHSQVSRLLSRISEMNGENDPIEDIVIDYYELGTKEGKPGRIREIGGDANCTRVKDLKGDLLIDVIPNAIPEELRNPIVTHHLIQEIKEHKRFKKLTKNTLQSGDKQGVDDIPFDQNQAKQHITNTMGAIGQGRAELAQLSQELLRLQTVLAFLISALFDLIDPVGAMATLIIMSYLPEEHWGKNGLFPGMEIIANYRRDARRDRGSAPGLMNASEVLGDFSCGDYIFPNLGISFKVPPGTIVFFCGKELKHQVGEFEGNRISLQYFTHQTQVEHAFEHAIKGNRTYGN